MRENDGGGLAMERVGESRSDGVLLLINLLLLLAWSSFSTTTSFVLLQDCPVSSLQPNMLALSAAIAASPRTRANKTVSTVSSGAA